MTACRLVNRQQHFEWISRSRLQKRKVLFFSILKLEESSTWSRKDDFTIQNAIHNILEVAIFFKLFISNQNYIRFYKLICCDSVWREEAYPKISPHNLLLGRLALSHMRLIRFTFRRLLRIRLRLRKDYGGSILTSLHTGRGCKNTVEATLFVYYLLLDVVLLLRHVSVQFGTIFKQYTYTYIHIYIYIYIYTRMKIIFLLRTRPHCTSHTPTEC
jgi:hypothetical protein